MKNHGAQYIPKELEINVNHKRSCALDGNRELSGTLLLLLGGNSSDCHSMSC